MDIFLTIVFGLSCLIFRKSKTLTVLVFTFMWTLWGWNTWNGDYDGYSGVYSMSAKTITEMGYFEFGYQWLNYKLLDLGFDFQEFLIIVSFFVLSGALYFTLKFTKYPALYSFFYYFIFIMEFVFIRYYIVDTLLLLAFALAFKEVKNYKYWFIGLLFVCISLHSTALVLLIFIYPLYKVEPINLRKVIPFYLGIMLASAYLFEKFIPFFGKDYTSKLSYYSSDQYFTTILAHLSMVIIAYYFFNNVLKAELSIPVRWKRIYTMAINVNVVSLFYLSLYFHIPYFSRIFRFLFALNIALMISAFYFVKYRFLIRRMTFSGVVFIILFLLVFSKTNFPYTIIPIYKCNLIWGDELYIPNIPN